MTEISNGSTVGGSDMLVLSIIHGVILAFLLIGFLRLPRWLPFARIVQALIAIFALFLLIDDLINNSLKADLALLCAAGLTLACAALYGRMHGRGHEPG
jgi:hypothetical protein